MNEEDLVRAYASRIGLSEDPSATGYFYRDGELTSIDGIRKTTKFRGFLDAVRDGTRGTPSEDYDSGYDLGLAYKAERDGKDF